MVDVRSVGVDVLVSRRSGEATAALGDKVCCARSMSDCSEIAVMLVSLRVRSE